MYFIFVNSCIIINFKMPQFNNFLKIKIKILITILFNREQKKEQSQCRGAPRNIRQSNRSNLGNPSLNPRKYQRNRKHSSKNCLFKSYSSISQSSPYETQEVTVELKDFNASAGYRCSYSFEQIKWPW